MRKKSLLKIPEYWIVQRPWAEDELEFQIKDAMTGEARTGQEIMGSMMGNIPIEYFGLLFGLKLSIIKQWFFKLNWFMHKTLEAKN